MDASSFSGNDHSPGKTTGLFKRHSHRSPKSTRWSSNVEPCLVRLCQRVFVAKSIKSLLQTESGNAVLYGWVTDPNGVLPQSMPYSKLSDSLPGIQHVPGSWLKEVFYEISVVRQIPNDDKCVYLVNFSTSIDSLIKCGLIKDTSASLEKGKSRKTLSEKVSRVLPHLKKKLVGKLQFAPLADCTLVKMCSVNSKKQCSKPNCLAKSPTLKTDEQAQFDSLIQNIFSGAVLTQSKRTVASKEPPDQATPVQEDLDDEALTVSKSVEVGDNEKVSDVMKNVCIPNGSDIQCNGSEILTDFVTVSSDKSLASNLSIASEFDNTSPSFSFCPVRELKVSEPSTNLITVKTLAGPEESSSEIEHSHRNLHSEENKMADSLEPETDERFHFQTTNGNKSKNNSQNRVILTKTELKQLDLSKSDVEIFASSCVHTKPSKLACLKNRVDPTTLQRTRTRKTHRTGCRDERNLFNCCIKSDDSV